MYQIICPECGHVDTSPFVRLEAVTVCSAHRHRFRIAAPYLKHLPTEPGPDGFADDALLTGLADIAQARRSERQRLDQQGNVIGLSGLSNLMKKEKERAASKQRAPAPAAGTQGASAAAPSARADAAPTVGAVEPIPTAPPRWRRLYVLFTGGICLAAGLLGAGLMLLSWDLPSSSGPGMSTGAVNGSSAGGAGEEDGEESSPSLVVPAGGTLPPGLMDLDPALEIADTEALEAIWTFQASAAPLPPQVEGEIAVEAWALTYDTQGVSWLSGRLMSRHPRWIASARLKIVLVDSSGRIRAEGMLPVRGLGPWESLPLRLPYPREAMRDLRPMVVAIEQVQELPRAEKITDMQVVPMGSGPGAMLQLTASNPAVSQRRGMIFVITAEDPAGQMLVRRVFDRQRSLSAVGRMAIYLRVPLPGDADLDRWRVYGVVYD